MTQEHLREAIQILISRIPAARRQLLPAEWNFKAPSNAFLYRFCQRHSKELVFVRPVTQKAVRFRQVNSETITNHFATLKKLISEYQIDASRLFNLDECGCTPNRDAGAKSRARRLMPRRGARNMRRPDIASMVKITMMPVISAAGEHGPPLFVMKGTRVPYRISICNGTEVAETPLSVLPRHSVLAMRDENGGVDRRNFISWAQKFVLYVSDLTENNRSVLLVYDGYRSHLSLEVLELFSRHNVVVHVLPCHTSGKTQPCDSVLLSSFKHYIDIGLQNCMLHAADKLFDVYDFCSVLRDAYDMSVTRDNICASFLRSGLWPLDPCRILGNLRPASAMVGAPILTVKELDAAFKKRWVKLRKKY